MYANCIQHYSFLWKRGFIIWVFIHIFLGVLHIKLCFGTAFSLVVSHSGGLLIYNCTILEWNHKFHTAITDDVAIYNLDLVLASIAGFEYPGAMSGWVKRGTCPIKLFV